MRAVWQWPEYLKYVETPTKQVYIELQQAPIGKKRRKTKTTRKILHANIRRRRCLRTIVNSAGRMNAIVSWSPPALVSACVTTGAVIAIGVGFPPVKNIVSIFIMGKKERRIQSLRARDVCGSNLGRSGCQTALSLPPLLLDSHALGERKKKKDSKNDESLKPN